MKFWSLYFQILFYGANVVYLYFWIIWSISGQIHEKCKGYWGCARFLKETDCGYTVDVADGQWREFRGSLWLLWKSMIGIWILYQVFKLLRTTDKPMSIVHTAHFRVAIGLIILYIQHGMHSLIIIGLAAMGYGIAKLFPHSPKLHTTLTWVYAVAVLLFKESYRLKFLPGFSFLIPFFDHRRFGGMYGWHLPANFLILRMVSYSMDYHWNAMKVQEKAGSESGEVGETASDTGSVTSSATASATNRTTSTTTSTWDATQHSDHSHSSNSHVRRSVHFEDDSTVDMMMSCASNDSNIHSHNSGASGGCPISLHNNNNGSNSSSSNSSNNNDDNNNNDNDSRRTDSSATRHDQQDVSLSEEDCSFPLYMSYILYAPLYMAGPIVTYSDYIKYTHTSQKTENILYYALRWLACFALMEFLTNRFPFFAIIQSGLLPYMNIAEIAVIFYMVLKLMWMKFLVVWRFFRLWAMTDGILPPENMTRCMSNNRSLEGFWKGWHSSYNKWLVRYIYKPCGGRHSRVWSVWVIFLFVALWHDIETKLFLWGLLNAFFLIVEVYAKKIAAESEAMKSLPQTLFQMVITLSGATYILVLIAVNLIGYSLGVGSVSLVMNKVLTWEGCKIMAASYYFLCVGVKLMMFIEDIRAGKYSSSKADNEKVKM